MPGSDKYAAEPLVAAIDACLARKAKNCACISSLKMENAQLDQAVDILRRIAGPDAGSATRLAQEWPGTEDSQAPAQGTPERPPATQEVPASPFGPADPDPQQRTSTSPQESHEAASQRPRDDDQAAVIDAEVPLAPDDSLTSVQLLWSSLDAPADEQANGDAADESPAESGVRETPALAEALPHPRRGEPPRRGSLRDRILTLLVSAGRAMPVLEIASILTPESGVGGRATVRKTLDRMVRLGEVVKVSPGVYESVVAIERTPVPSAS